MQAIKSEEKALQLSKDIWWGFLIPGIGIIGGTLQRKRGTVIRTSDKCLISRKGDCHLHRHPDLLPNFLTEHCIGYQPQRDELEQIMKDVIYCSGLAIANPVVRFLMYQINLDELNTVNIKEVIRRPRWPVVITIEPSRYHPKMYSVPLEQFRVQKERPNWCLKLANADFPYFAPSKDGYYQKLSKENLKGHLRYLLSNANGAQWVTDYAVLAKVPNPVNPQRSIIVCGGNHWLGTLGANALVSLTQRIPEKQITFRHVFDSMAWLGEVIENEDIKYFQAILRVTDYFLPGGRREIDVYCQGVFNLAP